MISARGAVEHGFEGLCKDCLGKPAWLLLLLREAPRIGPLGGSGESSLDIVPVTEVDVALVRRTMCTRGEWVEW